MLNKHSLFTVPQTQLLHTASPHKLIHCESALPLEVSRAQTRSVTESRARAQVLQLPHGTGLMTYNNGNEYFGQWCVRACHVEVAAASIYASWYGQQRKLTEASAVHRRLDQCRRSAGSVRFALAAMTGRETRSSGSSRVSVAARALAHPSSSIWKRQLPAPATAPSPSRAPLESRFCKAKVIGRSTTGRSLNASSAVPPWASSATSSRTQTRRMVRWWRPAALWRELSRQHATGEAARGPGVQQALGPPVPCRRDDPALDQR